jgi:hypothetical protein
MPMIEKIVQTAKQMVNATVESERATVCWPEAAWDGFMARTDPLVMVRRDTGLGGDPKP